MSFVSFGLVLTGVSGANILFLSLLPAITHHVWNEAVVRVLLANGHNVTMLTHDATNLKQVNYTVLKIEGKLEVYLDEFVWYKPNTFLLIPSSFT